MSKRFTNGGIITKPATSAKTVLPKGEVILRLSDVDRIQDILTNHFKANDELPTFNKGSEQQC